MKRLFASLKANDDGSSLVEVAIVLGFGGFGLNFFFPGMWQSGHVLLRTAGRTFGWW